MLVVGSYNNATGQIRHESARFGKVLVGLRDSRLIDNQKYRVISGASASYIAHGIYVVLKHATVIHS